MIKDSGHREPMGDTGFVRDTHQGKGRMDLLPWYAIIELSKHCEEGALKYGERNIDKGAPLHSLLDSGARHLAKVMAGETDEDHLRAACWNLMWALQQRTTHPELDDMPKKEPPKIDGSKIMSGTVMSTEEQDLHRIIMNMLNYNTNRPDR